MLIPDEATARVDTLTEQLIQATLQRLLTGRTAIVTAHRLSTIRNAELICVVHTGRIIERGRHEALVAHGGLYRQLYDRRFVDVATDADDYRTISIVSLFSSHIAIIGWRSMCQWPPSTAAFSRNNEPSRMYRRSIVVFLCPVCCMITRSLTPAIAAAVTSPARRL